MLERQSWIPRRDLSLNGRRELPMSDSSTPALPIVGRSRRRLKPIAQFHSQERSETHRAERLARSRDATGED